MDGSCGPQDLVIISLMQYDAYDVPDDWDTRFDDWRFFGIQPRGNQPRNSNRDESNCDDSDSGRKSVGEGMVENARATPNTINEVVV